MIEGRRITEEFQRLQARLGQAPPFGRDGSRQLQVDGSVRIDGYVPTAAVLRFQPPGQVGSDVTVSYRSRPGDNVLERDLIASRKDANGGDIWTRNVIHEETVVDLSTGQTLSDKVSDSYSCCPDRGNPDLVRGGIFTSDKVEPALPLTGIQRDFLDAWNIAHS